MPVLALILSLSPAHALTIDSTAMEPAPVETRVPLWRQRLQRTISPIPFLFDRGRWHVRGPVPRDLVVERILFTGDDSEIPGARTGGPHP